MKLALLLIVIAYTEALRTGGSKLAIPAGRGETFPKAMFPNNAHINYSQLQKLRSLHHQRWCIHNQPPHTTPSRQSRVILNF
jgi:hypothetical protein